MHNRASKILCIIVTGGAYAPYAPCLSTPLKPGPEDCYRRCGGDKIRQTVPDTCSGDRESSVTDGKESFAADNQ